MAAGPTTAAPPAPTGVFNTSLESPALCVAQFRGPLTIVLVGAGGTGARIMPPLTQMLRQGDSIAVVDHDIVEDRNLMRQHFVTSDIGQHKATVMMRRYSRPGRIDVRAFTGKLEAETAHGYMQDLLGSMTDRVRTRLDTSRGVVFIGAVDNAEARLAIKAAMEYCADHNGNPSAWIDVGNETRGGQVLLNTRQWLTRVRADGQDVDGLWSMRGIYAMPQLLKVVKDDPSESCGMRIDLQTVQVNHLSAACALNCLSWLLLGIPFSNTGAFFSTLNAMQPIPIGKVDWSNKVLYPTEQFAARD